MPGKTASESDVNLPEELPSLLGTLAFRIVHYCYLLYSTACHLRKYWDVKLTHLGSEQVTY